MQNKTAILCLFIAITVSSLLSGCSQEKQPQQPAGEEVSGTSISARTGERYFEVYDNGQWSALTVKGVNIGTSLPGRWYTEFPADRELYRTWLEEIAAMNANTVRLYTLLDPAFYAVLAEFNSEPGQEPLWLIQEIWPHDEVPDLNLHDSTYSEQYKREVETVIAALHGDADIPSRPYRAYGNYSADVSPYILGILVGRELEPEEAASTNNANPGLNRFRGNYVLTTGEASPTEVWLAEMCDYVLSVSETRYNRQYPVGFVSWPTLDPLTHPTEWEADGTPGYNDREVVNPNIFRAGPDNKAGFFGAYHIYPNYPDFMNNEPSFAEYSDDQGIFRYKGYLNQFMAIHPPYPALVAEFGISTSLNTAHFSPDGLHHGGLTEREQGEMTVRMMKSILGEGYAGGIIFEWTDEWAKKTWNTEPFMVPWERQVLWHNAMCPEQNYGIIAVEPALRSDDEKYRLWLQSQNNTVFKPVAGKTPAFGKIRAIEFGSDESFIYLRISLGDEPERGINKASWEKIGLAIGIDFGFHNSGEVILPLTGLPVLPSGVEFYLNISPPDKAELLSVPTYNRGLLTFNPQPTRGTDFIRIETLVNRERLTADGRFFPALFSDESILNQGSFNPADPGYNSLAHWHFEEESGRVEIRLPWMLFNIADPTENMMLRDENEYLSPPARDIFTIEQTEGILVYVASFLKESGSDLNGNRPEVIDFEPRRGSDFDDLISPYIWPGWERPLYRFRQKESYTIIADYFSLID